jgi:hypothetical protein
VVTLNTTGDYVVLLLVAAGVGAIGGFGAALVPTSSPGVNNPRWLTGAIVGAIAAVAVLLVLPGTKETTLTLQGHAVTSTSWSLLRVVPVSLVAGWAGPKVLASLQDRLAAAAKEAQLEATAKVAKTQVEQVASVAHAAASEHAPDASMGPAIEPPLQAAVTKAQAAIDDVAQS